MIVDPQQRNEKVTCQFFDVIKQTDANAPTFGRLIKYFIVKQIGAAHARDRGYARKRGAKSGAAKKRGRRNCGGLVIKI